MNAESTPRLVALTPELLDWALAEVPRASGLMRVLGTDGGALRMALDPPNIARALIGRGRVLAVGGIIRHWPGRGEAWLLKSVAATRRDLVLTCRAMQGILAEVQREPEWRRIEMQVLASEPWRQSFAATLGFTAEGLMRAWDPDGRDFWLYARVVA